MGLAVSSFPALPASIQTLTLEDAQYRLRLTWRHRTQSWYADLYLLDGTALALGRRLSPGWGPLLGLSVPAGPPGILYVRGADGYGQADLGELVKLIYYTQAEIAAAAVPSTAASPSVTL